MQNILNDGISLNVGEETRHVGIVIPSLRELGRPACHDIGVSIRDASAIPIKMNTITYQAIEVCHYTVDPRMCGHSNLIECRL